MARLRNKPMRYTFLGIVVVLAASSLSSCQAPHSQVLSEQSLSPILQKPLALNPLVKAIPLRHAVLHVPQ